MSSARGVNSSERRSRRIRIISIILSLSGLHARQSSSRRAASVPQPPGERFRRAARLSATQKLRSSVQYRFSLPLQRPTRRSPPFEAPPVLPNKASATRGNCATAYFPPSRAARPWLQRPLSRTHIVRDARKFPTSDETALPRLFAHTRRIPSFLRQLIRSVKPSATHGNAVLRRNSAIELFSTSHVTLSAVLTLPVRVLKLSATRGNSIFLRSRAAALFPAPRNVSSSPRTPLPRAVKTSRRAKFPSPPSRAGFVCRISTYIYAPARGRIRLCFT